MVHVTKSKRGFTNFYIVAIFGQWSGNGAVDYFLDGVLTSAGITEQLKKMNINLGKSCMQLTFVSTLLPVF